jgi:hypothetical protein
MGNFFGKAQNIESRCKELGYKKSKLVNKYISEKSKNYYKKKHDLGDIMNQILQSKLLITDLFFNNIFLKALNSDIYSDIFKQTFIEIFAYIDEKPKTLNKKYITLLVRLIELKVFDSITINRDSTRYKHTFTINDILTIYRYRLAIQIYRYSQKNIIRKKYISMQLSLDINRSIYYSFVDNNNKFLYINPYFKNHNFSKNPLTSESICNINLKIDNKSNLYEFINNNNSYDTEILDLIPGSEIKENNNSKIKENNNSKIKENNNSKIKENNNNNKKLTGNLSNKHKNNLKILLIQDFLNTIITHIIQTYFDCSFSSAPLEGKMIYACTGNSLIIYICVFKCGISESNILPSGFINPDITKKNHGKNYVINVNLITGYMTFIQHDIETYGIKSNDI